MKLVTSCKDCVFAIYKDITQIGCHANRLDNLDVDECYDDDKEFYVTKNVSCLGFRQKSWLRENESLDSAVERAKKELAFSYTVITSIDDIEKKLKYIRGQKYRPTAIYIYGSAGQQLDNKLLDKSITYVQFQSAVKDPVNRIFKRLKKPTNVFYIDNAEDVAWPVIEQIDDDIQILGVRKTIAVFQNSSSFIMPAILYTIHNTMTPSSIIDYYCENLPATVWRL